MTFRFGAAAGLAAIAALFNGSYTPARAGGGASTAGIAREIGDRHGLTVVRDEPQFPVATGWGRIGGYAGAPRDVDSYLPILSAEWGLYPRGAVQRSGLKRIILCSGLTFAGQRRTAIPDFEHDDLYLDVGRGRYSEAYTRTVIHHEYFHVIDWRDDGRLYEDPSWVQLNPAGFRYGRGGAQAQNDATGSLLDSLTPGFLDRYATSGVEEDKAETFANMVVRPGAVDSRTKRDPVLAAKVARMKSLVQTFCGDMNGTFWSAVRKLRGAD
jgi:hypothetical protein